MSNQIVSRTLLLKELKELKTMSEKEVLKRVGLSTFNSLLRHNRISVRPVNEYSSRTVSYVSDEVFNYDYCFFGLWGAYKEKTAPVSSAEIYHYMSKHFILPNGSLNMKYIHQSLYKLKNKSCITSLKLTKGSVLWSPIDVTLSSFEKTAPKIIFKRDLKDIYEEDNLNLKEKILNDIERLVDDEGYEAAKYLYEKIGIMYLEKELSEKRSLERNLKEEISCLEKKLSQYRK